MRQRTTPYLPVWQLIVFSILTLGMYTMYWYYQTWKYLKDTTHERMSAGWRTFGMTIPVVNFFVGFRFFKKLDQVTKLKFSPAFLAALFGMALFIALWFPLAGFLVFIPLGIAQSALNRTKETKRMRWSRGEIITCALLTIFLSPVGAVLMVSGIRTFIMSPFQVEGTAMADTLASRQRLIVNKWVYKTDHPRRGDIVVFHPPSDPERYYVDRIIGLPKETVVIRDGNVYILRGTEEMKLEEPYLNARNQGNTFRYPPSGRDGSEIRYEVPNNHYFVLGDNRQGSQDSRGFSDNDIFSVSREAITGRAWLVVLPLTDMRAIKRPTYSADLR